MTDELQPPAPSDPDRSAAGRPLRPVPPLPPPTERRAPPPDLQPRRPEYRGEELDPERGPGLGCFWFQVIVLTFFIVIIPVGLNLNWPFELLAVLLFIVIGLLLLTGQTVIFLLRLVAADRRATGRRRPIAGATKTVGELEDELGAAQAAGAAAAPGAASTPDAPPAPDPVPAAADVALVDNGAAPAVDPASGADAADDPASGASAADDAPPAAPDPDTAMHRAVDTGAASPGDPGPEPGNESAARRDEPGRPPG